MAGCPVALGHTVPLFSGMEIRSQSVFPTLYPLVSRALSVATSSQTTPQLYVTWLYLAALGFTRIHLAKQQQTE